MNKMLVVVFDTEAEAYEGLRALKDLHSNGDVTLYATAVVAKDAAGTVSVKEAADEGPVGTGVGLLTGSLLGLLGGPIGLAIGATAGSLAGMLYDLSKAGIDADYLDEVSGALTPERVAVLADVDEAWVTPVDVRMGKLGGTIFRTYRDDFVDARLDRDATALAAELKALDEELKHVSAENRAALQARIGQAKQKLHALEAKIETKQTELKNEMNAKLSALREQAKKASQARKTQAEQRAAQIKAEYEARQAKLNEAKMLIGQALGPNAKAQARRAAIEDKLRYEAGELSAALKAIQDDLAGAAAEAKSGLYARIDEVRDQMAALEARLEANLAGLENELNAKLNTLREQAKTASQARKAEIEQQVAETKADYESRRAKLNEASKLIKEALGPKALA